MQGIKMFARSIGEGTYQAFVQNVDYPCDFIRIVNGHRFRDDGSRANYIYQWKILTPFKPGDDPIFIGSFTRDDLRVAKLWYAFDSCTSKPTKFVEGYEVHVPAKDKLPATVGATIDFAVKKRASQDELKQHIENIRVNMKDQIQLLLGRYMHALQHATTDELKEAIADDRMLGQQYLARIARLDYRDAYNAGITLHQAYQDKGDIYAMYYKWFITDFGLPEPTGTPPSTKVKLPIDSLPG